VARFQAAFVLVTCVLGLVLLGAGRFPAAPVNVVSHAFTDEQALARGMRVQVPLPSGGYLEQPGNPVKLSMTFEDVFTAPPRLGEHTAEVLTSLLGLDSSRLQALAERGVIELAGGRRKEIPAQA
jgi:crotonobetainyl-CoA:carnitine CoA-transferase CaiB-like acyl-CoA transferase